MKGYVAILVCCLVGAGALGFVWAQSGANGGNVEDAFYIRSAMYEGHRLRPPVEFTHLNHVENYTSDCTECHHEYLEGEPVQRCGACHKLKDTDEAPSLKKVMHQNCRTCHIEAAGVESPAPTKCHECHGQIDYYDFAEGRTKPSVVFTHLNHWKKYTTPCTRCHHKYQDGENVWSRGDPVEKCNTCHKAEPQGDAVKLRTAFHTQCKGCHKGLLKEGKKAPYRCSECHYVFKDHPYRAFPKLEPNEGGKETTGG